MSSENGFNVLDMAQEYAKASNVGVEELFKKPEPAETSESNNTTNSVISEEQPAVPKAKTPWVPDASLIEGMSELSSGPITYDKKDLEVKDQSLENITDTTAIEDSRQHMDEMSRKHANIEDAKKRHGIKHFQIPEGEYHVSIFAAAGDTNYKRAQEALDEIFKEIKEVHPEFILEYVDEKSDESHSTNEPSEEVVTEPVREETKAENELSETANDIKSDEVPSISDEADVKIVIDKSNLPQVAWSEEELDKIRKSRSIELDIVETKTLEYTNIEDADNNFIDALLLPYQKKSNDIDAALPASKYRATFTGLTYTEVIDLSNSTEMNTIDGERKKWSICFNHIKNQSIGPWEDYFTYVDPTSGKIVKTDDFSKIPDNTDEKTIHHVSKFEDFLKKTSFIDLEYILWKILCATTMDQEIIQIDCHANYKGKPCNKSYDWIYCPSELLDMNSINPAVLEELEKTATVASSEDILKNYNTSMLRTDNMAKLHTSGISVVFGHISAYDYLESVYEKIQSLQNEEEYADPTIASKSLNYTTLTAIKAFLIPKPEGGFIRIKGTDNLLKVINTLDEIDWQTLGELVKIMIQPYEFKFSMRNIVCPQCKNRSDIPITNMARLLFIVARSLSSVNVVLKRT